MPSSSIHDSLRECWKYRSAASIDGPINWPKTRSRSVLAKPPGLSSCCSARVSRVIDMRVADGYNDNMRAGRAGYNPCFTGGVDFAVSLDFVSLESCVIV